MQTHTHWEIGLFTDTTMTAEFLVETFYRRPSPAANVTVRPEENCKSIKATIRRHVMQGSISSVLVTTT